MAKQTSEELIILRLNATIKKIKNGTQAPILDEAETASRFKRLKPLNIGMYEDLLGQYHRAVSSYVPAAVPASRRIFQNS